MNDLTINTEAKVSLLDNLAQEARYYSQAAVSSVLQLGRVFTQAKELVPHGEWQSWISENAGCSERSAQNFMAAYKKFGGMGEIEKIGSRSKLFKLLSLPDGTEEKFLQDNDISAMTAREVEKAVQRTREESMDEIQRERKARLEAEKMAEEMRNAAPVMPEEAVNKIRSLTEENDRLNGEIERVKSSTQDILMDKQDAEKARRQLEAELRDREEMMQENQEEIDRLQNEILSMKSQNAKGNAERAPADELTVQVFSSAVRSFMGSVARLPHMAKSLSRMDMEERERYEELLSTVEKWARDSRKAMDTIHGDGVIMNV